MKRIHTVDIMRGIVMIIMALDHTRDMLHVTSLTQQPTNLATTTPVLFFTRWVTHLCAPTFVFLSGVSAFLSMKSKNDLRASRQFLFTRGLWLIVLEFTVAGFGVWFDIHFNVFLFGVIATIGFGFIALGLLLKVSPKTIGIIGIIIIFLHNLVTMPALFSPAAYSLGGDRLFMMVYTPVPWMGIMLAGFGAGKFFLFDKQRQKSLFLKLGLFAIGLFVLLRFINIYGDPGPWSHQKSGLFTFLSFINLTKYPPSLDFDLVFLGVMLIILAFIQNAEGKWIRVYGKVPLFYYIVHWYIIHPIMFVMVFMQGFKTRDMVFGFNFGRPQSGSGLALWAVYLIWIGVVAVMYPVCKWYGQYKEKHKEKKWLRYL